MIWESKQGEENREIQLFTKRGKCFPKSLAWKEAWNGRESGSPSKGTYEMSQEGERDLRKRKIYFYITHGRRDSKRSS